MLMLIDEKHLQQIDLNKDYFLYQLESPNPRKSRSSNDQLESNEQTRGCDSLVKSVEPANFCCSAVNTAFFFSSFILNSRSLVCVGPNPFSVLPYE